MDKIFNHKKYESNIYKLWEKARAFTPKSEKSKKPFTIIMPPPNANMPLHIGHARFVTIEDALTRYWRMKGYSALWLPGADHAGIETQFVFEKKLKAEGKSRGDFDQDTLYNMIWDYVEKNKGIMEDQLRDLGASCDWSRNKYTLDKDIVKVVYKTFKKLYKDGLVYRGERLVNYCTFCGTSYSELEIVHQERSTKMYYIDYGPVTIATVRPETNFADVAVAINPNDKKNIKLIGKTAIIPIINREVPIISDTLVDPELGTGALKVTPGHSPTDFEIGKKHKLPVISVIDLEGKMINTPKQYIGLRPSKAREAIVADLEKLGKIKKVQEIKHSIGVCYKHNQPIEPLISKQWFINIKPLAKEAIDAINTKKVSFVALKNKKIALHWLRNIKDWNISRQIVWGIRIPAWRCQKCLEWTITQGKEPVKCDSCNNELLIQDTDTFDTWFSSGQWPFATLQTTKKGDFENFYPTSVMNTGYDILFFWVLRMIMLGIFVTGKVPFKKIFLHGLVRDKQKQKISKSKGNTIDPIEMIEKYGADATRMSLVWGANIDNDITLNEDNIRGQRNFANKIWNIARFVLENKSENAKGSAPQKPRVSNSNDKLILGKLKKTTKKVTSLMDKYKLNEATEAIYQFVWYDFAGDYLESTKSRREESQKTLAFVLSQSLILLHPFMPFVTETIWQQSFGGQKNLLINSSWPTS